MFVVLDKKNLAIDTEAQQQQVIEKMIKLGVSHALVREEKTVLGKKFEAEIGYLTQEGQLVPST